MADEKLNTGPAENISPEAAEPIITPEQAAASEPQQEQTGPAIPESGDVVVSFDKINELMAEKRQNARAEVEKAEPPETPEAAAPGETPQPANTEEPKKPRRGRPPKAEKAATENQKAEKSAGARKGRPPKADKAAPDKPKPSKRDKVSRSDGKAPDAKEPIKPAQDTALKETAAVEQTAPEPTTPPRPVEEGKLVYLKLSEVHPFHTFRPHPFKVRDDAKMQEIVASIRVNGVMVPGLARPEKDGNGYEIVAGHRRTHGSELAGLEEMPFIVREMTDHEAVQAMKDSNKQRDGMLPSELAALLELEVEDIKHQGGRLKGVAEGDVGKRSVEIVGEAHDMNYKKVMRYLRLSSLVPELLDKVDDKKMGFMPAVELSYIKPKNQRLIAVSIDGEQASPSLAQAKRLRELDKEGKLNGDVIDGILSEQKKEDRGVIISTAELEKYFGKEVTPAKMKEQIMFIMDRMAPLQIKNYLEKQAAESGESVKDLIKTWKDYLNMAIRVGVNVQDSVIYRARKLMQRHNEMIKEIEAKDLILRAGELEKKYPGLNRICRDLKKYEYADKEYQIVVPEKVDDILYEAKLMHHCVNNTETYYERMSQQESYILFLRKAKQPTEAYYTLEVEPDGTIRQTRTFYNQQNEDIELARDFLIKWQKQLKKKLAKEDYKLAVKSQSLRKKEIDELRNKGVRVNGVGYCNKLLAEILEEDLMEAGNRELEEQAA